MKKNRRQRAATQQAVSQVAPSILQLFDKSLLVTEELLYKLYLQFYDFYTTKLLK